MNRFVLPLSLVLASVLPAQDNDAPKDFRFDSSGLGFAGIEQLAELRGKPVLVELWGIN
ncbi:MAG: hypothetical protein AB7I19_05070 [Planctomycetota bacterium]